MPNGYTVTDTQEITTLTPSGKTRTTTRVWLTTDLGASGTVDVPAEKWTKKDLPDILAEKAAELDLAFTL